MRKLLKSKKGGIPAINEIVMTFLNVTPKPILILIFILLVTTISSFVLPALFNIFGYACVYDNGQVELYQVPLSNLVEKTFFDISRTTRDYFGIEDYELPYDPFPYGDKSYLRIPEQCLIESDANGSEVYGYVATCTDCPTNANFFQGFYVPKDKLICVDDGYSVTVGNEGLLNQDICSQCRPPHHYYYNQTVVENLGWVFTIENSSLSQFVNEEYVSQVYLDRIKDMGGVKKTVDTDQFVSIQCEDVKKPNLYFFNIKVFDRTLWIYLVVAYGLITFSYFWYNHIGLV